MHSSNDTKNKAAANVIRTAEFLDAEVDTDIEISRDFPNAAPSYASFLLQNGFINTNSPPAAPDCTALYNRYQGATYLDVYVEKNIPSDESTYPGIYTDGTEVFLEFFS